MRPKVNKGRQRTIHLNERQQDGDVVIECKHRDNRITTRRSERYRVQTVKHRQLLCIINVLLHRICTNRTTSNYSAPVAEQSIAISLSVCLRAYLWKRWTNLHEMFCTDPLWPWLGLSLATLRYVMYFLFYG